MPFYNFKLTLKKELTMFEKSTFISDIKDSCVRYNQFVFGKNIKSVKSIKIDGVNVNVTLNLIHTISDKDFVDAISNVVKIMKQKGYSLKKKENDNKLTKKKLIKKRQKQRGRTRRRKYF